MSATLRWVSDKCGATEPHPSDPLEGYEVGDSEPCVACDKPGCTATLEEEES